jgi:hypothetical protein
VPLAHRNTINFFGIRPKSDYLVWYHDKDKGEFCAIDTTGLLTVWNVTTGKINEYKDGDSGKTQMEVTPKIFDFENYMVFSGD